MKENSLTLKWIPNQLKVSRLAFIVSKRVSKKAVLRNEIRRGLSREARLKLPYFNEEIDAIIIVHPGAEKKEGKELGKSLNKVFLRARLIKKDGRDNG